VAYDVTLCVGDTFENRISKQDRKIEAKESCI